MPDQSPIRVHDGKEGWLIYPEDAVFRLVEKMPPDEEGIVHVDASLIAKVSGWWYDEATGRIEDVVEGLNIPWSELEISDREAMEMEANEISGKMAQVSNYIMNVSRRRSRIDTKLYLAKSALDHAVNKLLSKNESKGAVAVRVAAIISSDKRLRNAKIEVMEGEALKRSLDGVSDALDIIWRTLSRMLSARTHEPVE